MTTLTRLQWQAGMAVSTGEYCEPAAIAGFGYECTTAGTAGTHEPTWPTTAGGTVTDGTIVWTARVAMTITWTARALYKSGASEPTWPTTIGGTVTDGNITWTAETPAITDPNCPQSKVAYAIASKVYSPREDALRFCATNDPRDWSSQDDAGFHPIGMHSPESPTVTALGEYRGRLAIWTASNLLIWTVDPDPANMGLFDNQPGLGTLYPKAVASVAGDLYFLTPKGVRSLSIAAGAATLNSGDVGAAIDALVVAKLANPAITPLATYYPGAGQYWLVFGTDVFVYSQSRLGKVGAWSRYIFPWAIEALAQIKGVLYLRAGNAVFVLDDNAIADGAIADASTTGFAGTVWWPYLDLDNPGGNKQLVAVDVVGYGNPSVSIGYDQTNAAAYTTPCLIPADTVAGMKVPIPVTAPSMAVKVVYAAGQAWQLNAVNLYLNDLKGGM